MTEVLRIAILAHSTNPRGGVVHALELGDALTRLGHDVTVHAPDTSVMAPAAAPIDSSRRRRRLPPRTTGVPVMSVPP